MTELSCLHVATIDISMVSVIACQLITHCGNVVFHNFRLVVKVFYF